MKDIYKVSQWKDCEDFVGQCAINYGKLLKGGDPDTKAMAKILLMDWQRGKIPYFVLPPGGKEEELKKEEQEMKAEEKSPNANAKTSEDAQKEEMKED